MFEHASRPHAAFHWLIIHLLYGYTKTYSFLLSRTTSLKSKTQKFCILTEIALTLRLHPEIVFLLTQFQV